MSGQRADPLGIAVRALTSTDLSVAALIQRLRRAGIEEREIEDTIGRLRSAGYLDDGRVARERARRLAERGYGDAAIDVRLERDGIEREARAAVLAELEPERFRAMNLARGGDSRRLAAALSRRGFGEEAIEAAVARLDGAAGVELR